MCGLAGILRWGGKAVTREEIVRMTQQVRHRGPNGQGYLIRETLGLGHTRLAIIDLETGDQPMATPDGSVVIVQNGEIYNYRDLRQRLEDRGHQFATRSDTEVILNAYLEWGSDCVQLLRGMFAFAIADFKSRTLFLARDHFGIKPLYYRTGRDYLAFGSQIHALRKMDAPSPSGSLTAIDSYLQYQYVPAPATIFKEIHKLPPASRMAVGFDGRIEAPERYWRPAFGSPLRLPEDEWLATVDEAITESVRAHLVADVPYGVFLSGGVDSSLVAMRMSRAIHRPIKAFCIGFEREDHSEVRFATEVAERCGFELESHIITDASLRLVPEILGELEEPFGDSSIVPTWYLGRLARSHVPMALSGDGADEMFAGYDYYSDWMRSSTGERLRWIRRHDAGETLRSVFSHRRLRLGSWLTHRIFVSARARHALWRARFQQAARSRYDAIEEEARHGERFDELGYAQYLDLVTYLPSDILHKVDVATMAHGLEARVPFIDTVLFDLVSRLPVDMKIASRNGRTVSKYVLKRLLENDLPDRLVHRPKQGFVPPKADWFLPGGAFRVHLDRMLSDPKSRLSTFFEVSQIERQLMEHDRQRNRGGILWLLLALGFWLENNNNVAFGGSPVV
jgi:asparagine synthase (glutamine-hydrolysing)